MKATKEVKQKEPRLPLALLPPSTDEGAATWVFTHSTHKLSAKVKNESPVLSLSLPVWLSAGN